MDWNYIWVVFAAVFVAELGDKTQLATILFASDARPSRLVIFLAASAALLCATALGVFAGSLLGEWVNPRVLRWVAGGGFILIGLAMLLRG